MLEISRIYLSSGLLLAIFTLIFHLVAMEYPRWKVYEHRRNSNETLRIGLFHRCENRLLNGVLNNNKIYLICDNNKYLPYNKNLTSLMNKVPWSDVQRACNIAGNPYNCDYTSVTKTLIASTIICVSTLSLSIISIYLHLLINQFKFKTHLGIAIITISLLFIAFIFNLITLILLSSTMSNDLYEYRYNFNYRLIGQKRRNSSTEFAQNIRQLAAIDYDIRLDWSAGLEIISLILSSFTLVSQILYLFSTYRNRIG